MLPGLSGLEMMVIAAVALIVVGPKDLPLLMRKVGQFIGRLRSMATEFRASFDEMARQSELDELRKEVEAMRRGEPFKAQIDEAQVQQVFEEIDAGLNDGGFGPPAWAQAHGKDKAAKADKHAWKDAWQAMSEAERKALMKQLSAEHAAGMKAFANQGCRFTDQSEVPLNDYQRTNIDTLAAVEAGKGC